MANKFHKANCGSPLFDKCCSNPTTEKLSSGRAMCLRRRLGEQRAPAASWPAGMVT